MDRSAEQDGKPRISRRGLISLAMSGVIGSGWLLAAQATANLAGVWAWVPWVIGACALWCMALVMVALATRRPQTGALVRWPLDSSGRTVGTIIGAGLVVTYAANMPTEAVAVVRGLCIQVHSLCTAKAGLALAPSGLWAAAGVMVAVFLVNWLGLTVVTKVNMVFTMVKFVIPAVTAMLFLWGFRWHTVFVTAGGPKSSEPVLTAVTLGGVIYAFTGFQGPIDHAGEADKAHLRRATLLGLGIPALIFIALQIIFLGTVQGGASWGDLKSATPYVELSRALGLGWWYWALFVDGMASPFATALVFTSFIAVELRTAAEGRLIAPKALAKISGSRQVPQIALIANFGLGMVMLLLLQSWEKIVAATGIIALFVYSYTSVSYTAFRLTWQPGDVEGETGNPFTKRYVVLAPLSFTGATLLSYTAGWKTLGTALAFMFAVALIAYIGASAMVEVHPGRHRVRALWLIGYFAALYVLSLIGSSGPKPLIHYPWDIALTAALGVGAFYVGVYQSRLFREERGS
ncbi:MAG: APC family permease [Streptomycetaceae bacterium]|nr:APC family permease [Streptomycetaceae bacterium]